MDKLKLDISIDRISLAFKIVDQLKMSEFIADLLIEKAMRELTKTKALDEFRETGKDLSEFPDIMWKDFSETSEESDRRELLKLAILIYEKECNPDLLFKIIAEKLEIK